MRRIAYLSCCLLLLGVSVFAQSSKVRVSSLLLTQEKTGWRVNLVDDGTASEHALQIFQTGGLLISIDTKDAGRLGALAVLGAFNEAFSRAVPLTVKRVKPVCRCECSDRRQAKS